MEETNHQSRGVFSKFDEMSNEALEEILRADYMLPEREASDVDVILYITELLAKREERLHKEKSTNVDDAWVSFNQYYRPYTNDKKALYDFVEDESTFSDSECENPPNIHVEQQQPHKKRRIFRYMVAAALLLVIGSCNFTAKALGYDLGELIGRWTAELFSFGTSLSEEEDASEAASSEAVREEYSSLQAALDDYGITEAVVPTWFPDGYVFSQVEVYALDDSVSSFTAMYQDAAQETIVIDITYPAGITTYEKNNDNVTCYESGGIMHYIMTNMDLTFAAWINNDTECSIQGTDLSKEDLMKMVDSIYERRTE